MILSAPRSSVIFRPQALSFQRAAFASASGLDSSDIQKRILDVLRSFEKVEPTKVRSV